MSYLPTAGYGCYVYGIGPSTSDSAEACTEITSTTYQVTNTAKRVWDPTQALTVYANGVLVASSAYTFNYLFGIITFLTAPTAPVTVNAGYYLPIVECVLASKMKISLKQTLVDTTNFDGNGAINRTAGTFGAEGSFSTFDPGNTVLDGVSGTLESWVANQTCLCISVRLGTGNNYFRCFAYLDSLETNGAVSGAIESTVSWKSTDNSGLTGLGWGT